MKKWATVREPSMAAHAMYAMLNHKTIRYDHGKANTLEMEMRRSSTGSCELEAEDSVISTASGRSSAPE